MLRVEAASSNHSTAFFSKAEKNVSRIMKQQSRAQGGSQWTTATFFPANRTVTERPNHTGTHALLCVATSNIKQYKIPNGITMVINIVQ